MTAFILTCALMTIAAIALLAVPLIRRIPSATTGKENRRKSPDAPRASFALAVTVIALPLAAVAFYVAVSNYPWQNPQSAAAASPGHGTGAGGAALAAAITQLEARLAANPQDAEGWRMLGRSYLITGQAGKAVDAYEQAVSIVGGQDDSLQLDLAEALVLTDEPTVQAKAKAIVDAAVISDPTNTKALWYSGVMAMRAGDRQTAMSNFQKLLEQDPPPEIRQIVVEQLAGLGVQVPASAPSGRVVRVSVSLDPALAGKVTPGAILFVAARQPGIPGPPLAALRLPGDRLPTTVELSDANAVIEGRNLSSVDDVEIVARIAFGGTAVTAPGDLVGTAPVGNGGSPDVKVVIDRVAP